MTYLRNATRRTHRSLQTLARWLTAWSQHIWHRLTDEPGYAEAVAALVVASFELFSRSDPLRCTARDVARALLALARTWRPDPGIDDPWS